MNIQLNQQQQQQRWQNNSNNSNKRPNHYNQDSNQQKHQKLNNQNQLKKNPSNASMNSNQTNPSTSASSSNSSLVAELPETFGLPSNLPSKSSSNYFKPSLNKDSTSEPVDKKIDSESKIYITCLIIFSFIRLTYNIIIIRWHRNNQRKLSAKWLISNVIALQSAVAGKQ